MIDKKTRVYHGSRPIFKKKSDADPERTNSDFWLEEVPSEDFVINRVGHINPFKFIDEEEEQQRERKYKKDLEQSLRLRKCYQATITCRKKYLEAKVTANAGPDWFQDLSFNQMELVNELPKIMFSDLERHMIDDTQDFIKKIGVIPYIDGTKVWRALKTSNLDPVSFLFKIQKIVSAREQEEFEKDYPYYKEHGMPISSFSVNEKILLSCVFHYHFPTLLEKLDKILPPPYEKPKLKWGERKPQKKKKYDSPYLEPQPINEMCWYEERAVRELEMKVLKQMGVTPEQMALERKNRMRRMKKTPSFLEELEAARSAENREEQKKKMKRDLQIKETRKSVVSTISRTSWEIQCELDSMLDSEDKFFETYSISNKDLLGNAIKKEH